MLKKRIYTSLLLFFVALAPVLLTAQSQYPVRVTSVLLPPYSLRLNDYATTTEEKLQVQLLMTDLLEPSHDVVLQFWLESGTGDGVVAHSAPVVSGFPQINLQPGVPVTLSNVDLRALFEDNNLTGISPRQYARALPQGLYRFCFQVFDKYTGRTLSQKSCASVYLQQYDPPLLTLPTDSEIIYQQNEVQNILFQWMPRQLAPNTSYVFTLKELWDLGQSPVSGFLSSPVLWQEEVRTTSLYFGIDKVLLLPGKRYAWQVQAKSSNPALPGTTVSPSDDNGVYKNNGLSEIYYFDYAKPCVTPSFLTAQNKGRGKTEIRWSYSGEKPMNGYKVQYRRKRSSSQWEEVESYTEQVIIGNLAAATEYEYRVGSICGSLSQFTPSDVSGHTYAYSGIQYFKTAGEDAEDRNYQCGVLPNVDLSNRTPLKGTLGVNSVFMAGDFPVTVLSSEGHGGTYSGEGYIEVPYLGDTKLKVSFNAIQLNSEFQLISGYLETSYDVNEKNVHDVDNAFGQFFGDVGVVEKTLDYEVSEVYYDEKTGTIVIKGNAGADNAYDEGEDTASVQTLPKGKDYQIKDKNGNIWTVDEKGNVTKGGKEAEGGATTAENTEGVSNTGSVEKFTSEGIKVRFSNAPNSKYAFEQPTRALSDAYKKLSGSYLPFKAVENQQEEPFLAQVEVSDTSVNLDSLVFKTSKGIKIPSKRISGTTDFELTLKGRFDFATEEVQAVIKQGKKYKVAGAFYLVHLSPRTVKLNLVPTEEGMNLSARIAELQAIYKKVAVDVEVAIRPVFSIVSYLENGKLPSSDAFGDLSTYSEAERAIIHSYKSQNEVGLEYYIFVTNVASSSGQSGYMRLNGQFGFVFEGGSARTIAHELGHGAFRLEHPFKQFRGLEKGDTDNLMDYSGGAAFSYPHWQQINDPKLKLYAFQGQDEGEYRDSELAQKILQEIRCAYLKNTTKDVSSIEFYLNRIDGIFDNKFISGVNLVGKNTYLCLEYNADKGVTLPSNIEPIQGDYDKLGFKLLRKLLGITPPKHFKYKYNLGGLTLYTVDNDFTSYLVPTKERVQSDFNIIWSSINIEDGIDAKEFKKLKSIASCATQYLSLDNRVKVLEQLSKGKIREPYEDLILDILKTTPQADKQKLLMFLSDKFRIFSDLYNKMDNANLNGIENNKTRFLNTLYDFWKDSEFSKFTHKDYKYIEGKSPRLFGYDDKGKLHRGFSFSELRFDFDKTNKKIQFIGEDPGDLDDQIEILYTYSYHPFQPILVYDIKDEDKIQFANRAVPAFFFMGVESIKDVQARSTAFGLTFDVFLLTVGVGEISSLRELTGAYKVIRGTVLGVEITSSTLDIILNYSNACKGDEEFCEKVKKVNFWLQIASLSADVFAQRMVRKSAREVLENADVPEDVRRELRKFGGEVGNVVEDILPEIFGGARQYIRKTYPNGQEILNNLTKKFGKNQGAAAVIVQKWGDEGLAILNKPTVKNLDDVVNELLTNKTAYRHISSKVSYLEDLKLSGKIPKNVNDTYFSIDKFDNPLVAIDKMQLNVDKTDAIWRLEFDATQLINKASFPKGKWNNAKYIEVLTKSYPNFGSGGASQFITKSEIQLKRMVNLKTGEIIKF